jgi:hypothetical protein
MRCSGLLGANCKQRADDRPYSEMLTERNVNRGLGPQTVARANVAVAACCVYELKRFEPPCACACPNTLVRDNPTIVRSRQGCRMEHAR